jgi:hypothetical protein
VISPHGRRGREERAVHGAVDAHVQAVTRLGDGHDGVVLADDLVQAGDRVGRAGSAEQRHECLHLDGPLLAPELGHLFPHFLLPFIQVGEFLFQGVDQLPQVRVLVAAVAVGQVVHRIGRRHCWRGGGDGSRPECSSGHDNVRCSATAEEAMAVR